MKRYARSWKRSGPSGPRRGTTLVEALVGTALLGSLLVGILLSHARLATQSRRVELRLEACRIADELLEGWWPEPDKFPRNDSGHVAEGNTWIWRTQIVENAAAADLGAEVVALEILGPEQEDETPLARVEILLPARR